ncbi:MAG: putative transcriptional regulator [Acidobacteria bacterium]|nr:putative transcriptional regulator [Acidobacteriota bacterium]
MLRPIPGVKNWERAYPMQKKDLPSLYLQSPKLNQLNILREIAADAHVTQAELAGRCSLSVAMVNNYLKELCRIGLMEYHRRTIKSVTYHLTPAGSVQLDALQRELMREMAEMYVASKEQVLARITSLAQTDLHRVILFGSGHTAQLVFHALELSNVNILGICDDDLDLIGNDFCGREVMSPSQVRFLSPDAVIVARAPQTEEVCRSLESLADRGIKIIRLDGQSVSRGAGNQAAVEQAVPSSEIAGKRPVSSVFRSGNR